MTQAKQKKTSVEIFRDVVSNKEPERKTIPIKLPSWYGCVPMNLYVAAMTGSNLAVEVCGLIEYAFHRGHLVGITGGKDETDVADVKDNGGPNASILCALIDEATHVKKKRLKKRKVIKHAQH